MTTTTLRPGTDLVKLHPDVESGVLTEAVFAIDLGASAARDPNVPVVNRDPEAFFRSPYLTTDLRKLLDEVLASLAGKSGYNRVLKLRTPFGGGKSHTLAALLHAARARKTLNVIPESKVANSPIPRFLSHPLLLAPEIGYEKGSTYTKSPEGKACPLITSRQSSNRPAPVTVSC